MAYYAYRYYDPNLGRWISRDPIEESGGLNLYGFVGNDGVTNIDFLGLQVKWAEDEDADLDYSCSCCCAEDIQFYMDGYNPDKKQVKMLHKFNTGNVGHRLVTSFTMSNKMVQKGTGKPCEIEWWEYTNDPYINGINENTWVDLTKIDTATSYFSFPSYISGGQINDIDEPALDPKIRQNGTGSRTLHFKIVLKSGKGCTCEKPEVVRKATQFLKWNNGKMSDTDSYFDPFGASVPAAQ